MAELLQYVFWRGIKNEGNYMRKKSEGHKLYKFAYFYNFKEALDLMKLDLK